MKKKPSASPKKTMFGATKKRRELGARAERLERDVNRWRQRFEDCRLETWNQAAEMERLRGRLVQKETELVAERGRTWSLVEKAHALQGAVDRQDRDLSQGNEVLRRYILDEAARQESVNATGATFVGQIASYVDQARALLERWCRLRPTSSSPRSRPFPRLRATAPGAAEAEGGGLVVGAGPVARARGAQRVRPGPEAMNPRRRRRLRFQRAHNRPCFWCDMTGTRRARPWYNAPLCAFRCATCNGTGACGESNWMPGHFMLSQQNQLARSFFKAYPNARSFRAPVIPRRQAWAVAASSSEA